MFVQVIENLICGRGESMNGNSISVIKPQNNRCFELSQRGIKLRDVDIAYFIVHGANAEFSGDSPMERFVM